MPQQIDFQPLDFQPEDGPAAPSNVRALPEPRNNVERFQRDHADIEPMGGPVVPVGTLSGVLRVAEPAVRSMASKVMGILSKPAVGGTIGAAEGYREGDDISSAIFGGIAGATVSKSLGRSGRPVATPKPAVHPMAAKMSQAPPKRLIDLVNDPAALRAAVEQKLGPIATPPRAPGAVRTVAQPAAQAAKPSTLMDEVMRRDPNWRSVDAVPIDAIKRDITRGGSIIEAGESQIGLGERLAAAMKKAAQGDVEAAKEAEMLSRALRQRMHVAQGAAARRAK
jgi:hypothetical protein